MTRHPRAAQSVDVTDTTPNSNGSADPRHGHRPQRTLRRRWSLVTQRLLPSGHEPTMTAKTILATAIRLVAGVIFVSFGIGKFTDHASEAASFVHYGIPLAGASVWGVGLVETIGGLMLVLGVLTRWAALALAADMIGVIATAGRVDGGLLNLGLAPLLLVGMLVLLWTGPGLLSLDAALARSGNSEFPLGRGDRDAPR